jgi:hypothetical protein
MVDPVRHEVLYRVERDQTVRIYCVLWLGMAHYLGESAAVDGGGLLVAVDSLAAARTLQRWLRATKGLLADAVAAGHLDPAAAGDALRTAARRRAGDRETLALNE